MDALTTGGMKKYVNSFSPLMRIMIAGCSSYREENDDGEWRREEGEGSSYTSS